MKQLDKDLYFDNHILVADKMPNMATQKNKNEIGFEDLLKIYFQKRFFKEKIFLHPIHRIDKLCSGLVLFARTSKALSRLNQQMREKKIKRSYFAVIEGVLEKKEDILENRLEKRNFYSKVYPKESDKGKKAVLRYKIIKEKNDLSLVKIELDTGRYHQIRAQFSYIGHPIFGDKKYRSKYFHNFILLNSYSLEFLHPVTKEKISFYSDIGNLKKIISSPF